MRNAIAWFALAGALAACGTDGSGPDSNGGAESAGSASVQAMGDAGAANGGSSNGGVGGTSGASQGGSAGAAIGGKGGSATAGSAGSPVVVPVPQGGPGAYLATDQVWPNPIPDGGPELSKDFVDAVFTGRHIEYTQSDTWYPSWADDGELYSNYADGSVNGVGISCIGDNANTGRVKISGADPLKLTFSNPHQVWAAPGGGYNMRYPAGNLVAGGVWYSATVLRNALGAQGCAYTCTQGALVGFEYTRSPATAKTEADWVKTTHTAAAPLFPETGLGGKKVKFAEVHFVDFGKGMEHSPDGKAYLVGHGAANPADFVNWNAGSDIYLARIAISPDAVNDLGKWEFYKGNDSKNQPIWSAGFTDLMPILSWRDELGNVSITYDAPIKRYVMTLSRGNKVPDDWNRSDFFVLHSADDTLTSGWKVVRIWHDFGTFGYMPNVSSKFMSEDGRTFWMSYSTDNGHRGGVVSNPVGSNYSYDLREVRLVPAASGDGSLNGTVIDIAAGSVDLAAEGTWDWVHWGSNGFPGEDRKSGVSLIAMANAASMFSGVTKQSTSSGASSFTWSGGAPNASAVGSASGIAANDTNSGFTLTAPADTTKRTLKVYVGVFRARGELHAYLSDDSATPYRDDSVVDAGGNHNAVFTLEYNAASDSQRLFVTWANANDYSPDFTDKVALYAATLK